MDKEITDPCVLCKKSLAKNANHEFWLKGNNAQPLADGQCCDLCNIDVIMARINNLGFTGKISNG
jgi:hypothetical protein